MIWIISIVLILMFIVFPFIQQLKNKNRESFNALSKEIQDLIEAEKVEELARIIVNLEVIKQNHLAGKILSGIEYRSLALAVKVDKVRNKLRIEEGLGNLKNF